MNKKNAPQKNAGKKTKKVPGKPVTETVPPHRSAEDFIIYTFGLRVSEARRLINFFDHRSNSDKPLAPLSAEERTVLGPTFYQALVSNEYIKSTGRGASWQATINLEHFRSTKFWVFSDISARLERQTMLKSKEQTFVPQDTWLTSLREELQKSDKPATSKAAGEPQPPQTAEQILEAEIKKFEQGIVDDEKEAKEHLELAKQKEASVEKKKKSLEQYKRALATLTGKD